MGLFEGVLNTIVSHLKTKIGAGQPLERVKQLVVGDRDVPTQDNLPFIWVHYDSPAIEESWSAAQRRRDALTHIFVKIAAAAPGDNVEIPYGDATNDGILLLVEDVMDQLVEGNLVFDPSNRVFTHQVTVVAVENIGENIWGATIRLDLKQRYGDAGRG